MLTKAGETKNATEQSKLEEEVQLALIEGQTDQYINSNSNIEEKLKAIFEKSYGQGNIDVTKAGKNYKLKVKNSKTSYRIKPNGTVEKYEEMDPTNVYAKLDDDGTLHLRATQPEGYSLYTNSYSIESNWNTEGNASRESVLKVQIEEPIAPSNLSNMFDYFINLLKIQNMNYLHTENATSISSMFLDCKKLEEIDVSKFDTSKIINMNSLFSRCSAVKKLDVEGFDTSNVTNMGYMFNNCNQITNLNISNFDTSKVTDMTNMFFQCFSLTSIDVSNFDTSNVTKMSSMFCRCGKITEIDVSKWDTSKVSTMSELFRACDALNKLEVGGFNTSNVTNMSHMFNNCNQITNLNVSNFDTSKVTDMSYMFYKGIHMKNIDLSNKFIINEGTNINEMFSIFTEKKIKAKQDTVNRLKIKFTKFTDDNFEIIV